MFQLNYLINLCETIRHYLVAIQALHSLQRIVLVGVDSFSYLPCHGFTRIFDERLIKKRSEIAMIHSDRNALRIKLSG